MPSTQYYTDSIGGGIGNIVVMTGGGNDNGAGNADGRNDDGFSGPINFGYTLNFFGTNYTSLYANNNGNISFGSGISEYVPSGPTGAAAPVISPWFADVDTRGAASGVLHLRQDISNETILTWDQVGYYDEHDDVLASFQLIVRGPGYNVPVGEGSIGFFYKSMPWEHTDTSTTAAVGFGDGAGNSEVLAGSNTTGLNQVVQDHYIWFDQNLAPVPPVNAVPEPGTYALMLAGLGVLGMVARRRKAKAG
ncbi:MAG: nidogen-like domain-containing protein [Burkholderiaceae bacterium]